MLNTLYLPELRDMLASNNSAELREFCTALHPVRTVEFMEGLTSEESWAVLRHADLSVRAEIFRYFDHDRQVEIIENQDENEIAELITELAPDDRVDTLSGVEPDIVTDLLQIIPVDERRDILRLSAYPESTAGAVMTTEVAKLAETLTVKEALNELGRQAEELETIYYIYVVDEADHLRGIVSARQLVSAIGKPDTQLVQLMETELVTCDVLEDQEEVAGKVARYDFLAIPVVDNERRMLGIITHDDVIDVMREEATEDAHRIAAVAPLDAGYLKTHLLKLSWKRGIWLTILFIAAMLTAFALQTYAAALEKWTWLVLFVPLVISSGGNTGSQSATLIITALSTGDITLHDWWKVVCRELMMGLILGSFLATIGFIAAVTLSLAPNVIAATVVPITILLVVVCGTLAGSLLPLLFRRLGLDPALMSNPFVAGIIDILGIIIYMNVALRLIPLAG